MPGDSDIRDVFISYARADNDARAGRSEGWITDFVATLQAEHKAATGRELTCFFDQEAIESGHDWEHRIHHGVASASAFIAFISPNYFASPWCRKEWRSWIDTEIAKHVFSEAAEPIYIVPVPGLTDSGMAPADVSAEIEKLSQVQPPREDFLRETPPVVSQLRKRQLQPVHDFYQKGREALLELDLRKTLTRLAAKVQGHKDRVTAAALADHNTFPPYNKNFTGRYEELRNLRLRLMQGSAGVVYGIQGLGGIGKTELALTYAQAYAGVYPGGYFYLRCEGMASLRQAVLALGEHAPFHDAISDEERKLEETHFRAICRCLQRRLREGRGILLVLDNVTDERLVSRQQTEELTGLDGERLHLLFTTRLEPPAGADWMPLGALPEGECMELLEKFRAFADEAERGAAAELVRGSGGWCWRWS